MTTEKIDIYQRITDQIVAAIEKGTGRYQMPWHTSGEFSFSPVNAQSKKPYRGINVLILWDAAQKQHYNSGFWATYKQWHELGAQVRKGEKAQSVVFWRFSDIQTKDEGDESEEGSEKRIALAREYWVFNADQVNGFRAKPAPALSEAERLEEGERFFSALGADIRHGGN